MHDLYSRRISGRASARRCSDTLQDIHVGPLKAIELKSGCMASKYGGPRNRISVGLRTTRGTYPRVQRQSCTSNGVHNR